MDQRTKFSHRKSRPSVAPLYDSYSRVYSLGVVDRSSCYLFCAVLSGDAELDTGGHVARGLVLLESNCHANPSDVC